MVLNGLKIDAISSLSDGAAAIIGGDEIRVKRAVLCTNGLATRLIPELDVNPARNQVIVTSPIEGLALKGGFHMNRGYVYFRNVGDQVLIGGFRNTAPEREATAELGLTDDIQALLEETLREIVIPGKNFTVERRWSGIMGLGKTKKPIIDEVRPNIFAAVRMGGMGVAIGSLVGREVARLAMEGK
jgi:glycine/D-amino acid oxidase-like deaminating enzyme